MIVTLFFWFSLHRKSPLHTTGLHKEIRVTPGCWNDTRYDPIQELEMNVPKRSSAPIKKPSSNKFDTLRKII